MWESTCLMRAAHSSGIALYHEPWAKDWRQALTLKTCVSNLKTAVSWKWCAGSSSWPSAGGRWTRLYSDHFSRKQSYTASRSYMSPKRVWAHNPCGGFGALTKHHGAASPRSSTQCLDTQRHALTHTIFYLSREICLSVWTPPIIISVSVHWYSLILLSSINDQ